MRRLSLERARNRLTDGQSPRARVTEFGRGPRWPPSPTGMFSTSAGCFPWRPLPSRWSPEWCPAGLNWSKVLGGERPWGQGVFPLACWPLNADTLAPTASCSVHPVPSFRLYLLWRLLKTRPWLPAGPETEVISHPLEGLWGRKSTASPLDT